MDYKAIIFVLLSLVCFGLSDFMLKAIATDFGSIGEILRNMKLLLPIIAFGLITLFGFVFWAVALRYGDVSRLAPIQKMSLLITVPLGILILHEAFTWKTAAAAIFAVLAIIMIIL